MQTPLKDQVQAGKMRLQNEFTFQKRNQAKDTELEENFADLSGLYVEQIGQIQAGKKGAESGNMKGKLGKKETTHAHVSKLEHMKSNQNPNHYFGASQLHRNEKPTLEYAFKKKNSIFDLLSFKKKENLPANSIRKSSTSKISVKSNQLEGDSNINRSEAERKHLFYRALESVPSFGLKNEDHKTLAFQFPENLPKLKAKRSPSAVRNLFGISVFPGKCN